MAIELIPAQTTVFSSKFIAVGDRETANLIVFGLTGAETLAVLQSWDGGASFETAEEDGVPIELSATNKTVSVKGPIRVAVTKPVTGESVGVSAFVMGSI